MYLTLTYELLEIYTVECSNLKWDQKSKHAY